MRPVNTGCIVALLVLLGAGRSFAADELVVCGWFSSNALRCDGAGGSCATLVASGSGGLAQAHSIAIGPGGDLYLTSFGNGRVVRYDGDSGAFVEIFVPAGLGGMGSPTDCIFGPGGNLYVSSFNSDEVLRYDPGTGDFLGVAVAATSGVNGPIDVVFVDRCPADAIGSDDVGVNDLLDLLAAWGPCPGCALDLDGSGTIDVVDLLQLLSAWGRCP